MKRKYDWGGTLQGDEIIEKEVEKFDLWLNDYINASKRRESEVGLLNLGALFYGEYAKTQPWGENTSDCRAVFDTYMWLTFGKHAWWKDRLARPFVARQKKRERIYKNIARKRWKQSTNLGKNKQQPMYFTLCGIGPNNCFLELTPEVIHLIYRDLDDKDIPGLSQKEIEARENKNAKDFWVGVINLIDENSKKEILLNMENYVDLLIRGMCLYVFYKCGDEAIKIIENAFKKLGNSLKRICREEGAYYRFIKDEKTKEQRKEKRSLFEEKMCEGWEAFRNTVKVIEKDFYKGIEGRPEHYLVKVYQNFIKKGLPPKEEIPMDLTTPIENVSGEEEGTITLFDLIAPKLEGAGIAYPYYPAYRAQQLQKRRPQKTTGKELTDDDFKKMKNPERKKKVFNLYYHENCTHDDISSRLQVSKKTVQRDLKEIDDYITSRFVM